MFSTSDTIVAIATPPGRGGIGVVRISGPEAQTISGALLGETNPLQPRHATFAKVRLKAGPTPFPGSRAVVESHEIVGYGFSRTLQSPAPSVERPAPAALDQVIATFFPAPHSYTGDDVVELSAHGSPVILRAMVTAAIAAGARLAEPGEFTLRAFLNRRLDLTQAEAVADLVDAVTPLQARAAFDQLQGTLTRAIGEIDLTLFELIARLEASVDFPEEGYHFVEPGALAGAIEGLLARTSALLASARRGRLVREGFQVAIVGRPNVGKSSLFNALAGADRAIVTDVPGTTRDLVTEVVDVEGLRVTIVDTAGMRDARDVVEAEGVSRSRRAQQVANLVLVVLDRAESLTPEDDAIIAAAPADASLLVANKADRAAAWSIDVLHRRGRPAIEVSAVTGSGMEVLRRLLGRALDVEPDVDVPAITNMRHETLVRRAQDALGRARAAAQAEGGALSEEFVLADLQDARAALEEITGRRVTEDILAEIFSKFCIGK